MRNTMRRSFALVSLAAAATAGFAPAAFAHVGDHSHMSVTELVTHLSASLDHRSAIVAIGAVFAVIAVAVVVMRRKRAR
jgi:hypothetical protein